MTIFVSLDIEADGPSVANNNCIQIGLVACNLIDNATDENLSEWIVNKLSICIKPLEGHNENNKTKTEFWNKNLDVYNYIKSNEIDAQEAVNKISDWLFDVEKAEKIKYFVANPAAYDWMWFHYLYTKFNGKYQLPYTAKCISSMKFLLKNMGKNLSIVSDKLPHTHDAVDDAIEQAFTFIKIMELTKS